jgi:deoxyribodipyrimidine photo-lyase
MTDVPVTRVRTVNSAPIRPERAFVLYWMIAARRTRWNFALARAVYYARTLRRPLLVFEPLRCDYPWASDRLHAFVMQGMQDHAKTLARRRVLYHPYVERQRGDGKHLLATLASHAADPLRALPRMAAPSLPADIARRWPPATDLLDDLPRALDALPIDHTVPTVRTRGGQQAATRALTSFLDRRLSRYDADRNEPERDGTSALSPYLHFGHISVHEIVAAIMTRERWTTRRIQPKAAGRREGWWGMRAPAEAFLDELITWRELGFNMTHLRPAAERFESLPAWARATLQTHARDRRPHRYTLEQFESSATHDPLWNAAQQQIVREGRMHNYLRMLWGKKILEWSRTPREALATMLHLNNKYGLDGRDPNSTSGICWVLGRYDRPWGPERPIFGTIRYMSSENTARKFRVRDYIARYTDGLTR